MPKMKLISDKKFNHAVGRMYSATCDALGVPDKMLNDSENKLANAQVASCGDEAAVLDSVAKDLNPLHLLSERIFAAKAVFERSEGEEKDVSAFKQAFHAARAECIHRYKAEGRSTVLDYIKAACLALLGVLVAIITSPALLHKPYRDGLKDTFFSGLETQECRMLKKEVEDNFVDGLLEGSTPAG